MTVFLVWWEFIPEITLNINRIHVLLCVKAMSHGASKTLFSLETKHKTWCFDVFGVWHTAKHRCYETCLLCFDMFSKFRACSKFRKHVFGCFHWRPMGKRCLRHVTLSSFKMSSTPIKATGPLALHPPDATLFLIELFHSHDALWDIRSPNYRNQSVKRASWTSMRVNFTEKTGVVCTGMGKFKCKTFEQMVFWRPSGHCFFFVDHHHHYKINHHCHHHHHYHWTTLNLINLGFLRGYRSLVRAELLTRYPPWPQRAHDTITPL